MFRNKRLTVVLVTYFLIGLGAVCAGSSAYAQANPTLHIDIPVKLEKGNVVMDIGHLVFVGDMPFALGDLHLLASDYSDWNAKGQIIAVFHGDATYLVLNDDSYNADRHVATGNPYKELIAGMMKLGVQFELCGATAAAHHWGNANLLTGVKVNTNAMVRVTQLEQEGYTMIYE